MSDDMKNSSGVQQLIDRLHGEGVKKGQAEAEGILAEARVQAMKIIDDARREADTLVKQAQQESERTRKNGEEAVRLAGRDAILHLTEELRRDFERKLHRLVGQSLQDTEFLKQLVLEIARKAVPKHTESRLNLLLPAEQVEAATEPKKTSKTAKETKAAENPLDKFVASLAGDALRDGLSFAVDGGGVPGVRVQIVDDDLEIDLTTDTLAHLLFQHLSPRFQAIIQQ